MYKKVLTKSGFNDDITYTPVIQSHNSERKNIRRRKVIWFNPLYSMNMETNIDKAFLKLAKSIFQVMIGFIRYSTGTLLRLLIVA